MRMCRHEEVEADAELAGGGKGKEEGKGKQEPPEPKIKVREMRVVGLCGLDRPTRTEELLGNLQAEEKEAMTVKLETVLRTVLDEVLGSYYTLS